MKKLLSALLACSLSFMLLGFKGCCKQSAPAGAPKKVSKKTAPKTKAAAPKKVAYNALQSPAFADEETLAQFAYLDENQPIDDFDTDLSAANSAVDSLSQGEQDELNREIEHLVSLWSTDDKDMRNMAVDFRTLYLDSAPAPIETSETKPALVVATAEIPTEEETRSNPELVAALDQALEITREIEEETKDILPEELSA